MKKFTSIAIFLILCLYAFLSGLFLITKDYTGEKAEITRTECKENKVIVYIPKYMMRLKMPKEEWSGQNEFILQKDYEIFEETLACILMLMISGILLFPVALIGEPEIKLFE